MRMSDWSSDVCSSDLRTSPPLARSSPDNIAISDDLPDPDGPRIARLSPFGMERSTPLNICVGASRVPSERVTLRASIAIWARADEPCTGERNHMQAGRRSLSVGAAAIVQLLTACSGEPAADNHAAPSVPEIGRASCRARVCQYV